MMRDKELERYMEDGLRKLRDARNPYRDWGPYDPVWWGIGFYVVVMCVIIAALCLVV